MNGNLILIFDSRVEISNKYKKLLEQNHYAKVIIVQDKETFLSDLTLFEPDMVLISESVQENLSDLCAEIRNKKLSFRPVLVLLSKSSYPEDKTNALNSGADDFLSEPMDSEEFLARINAHLRRTSEENASTLTQLPIDEYSKKILRRAIKTGKNWAALLIGIDNFSPYKEIYGEIAANKIQQAFCAIIKATIEYDDFAGQLNEHFLILTSSYKAEKLADYLNYAFDSIAKKFYSQEDAQRNFIMLHGENKAGCKIPIMTTSIGLINSDLINYQDEIEVINSLSKVHKLAKTLTGSTKVIDRPLITSEEIMQFIDEKNIVVIEQDKDLAYLLETTLKIQGFNPIIFNDYDFSIDEILKTSPSLIILDNGKYQNKNGLELCKQIKQETITNIKIIFTDTKHEKEEILTAGADLYLPKPYEIMTLFQWIYKLLD